MLFVTYEKCIKMLAGYEGGEENKMLRRLVAKKDRRLVGPCNRIVRECVRDELHFARSDQVAQAAGDVLGAIGVRSALPALLDTIELASTQKKRRGGDYASVVDHALNAAAALHDARPSTGLKARFDRLEGAGGAIGKFASDRLLVLRAVADKSYKRIRTALLALNGASGDEEFSASVAALLADDSPCAIEFLVNRAAFEWSIRDPLDRRNSLFDAAVGAGTRAVLPLIRILELDESVTAERFRAGDALQRIGKAAIPALIKALKDSGSVEAYNNLRILKERGDLSDEDMKLLLSMNGRTLKEHTDRSPSCGHTDHSAVVARF